MYSCCLAAGLCKLARRQAGSGGNSKVQKSKLTHRLNHLLSEPIESALYREQHSLEEKIGSLDQPFILFGAGHLGRKVMGSLQAIGKTPVAFIDNNPSLWGKEYQGVPIFNPAEYAGKFDAKQIGVITTIWSGEATDKMSDRIRPLLELGFCNVAMFGHLAWKFKDQFLPHYSLDLPSKVISQADQIRAAFSLLEDEESCELFVNHIEWRLFLDYDLLPKPSREVIYFNNKFVNKLETEVLYDIGAYTGDSVESFLQTERGNDFLQIHSFEPSPNNYQILRQYIFGLKKISDKVFAHNLALGDIVGNIQVESDNGPASRVGSGSETVPVTTIDLFSESYAEPTFIKIDIEGFEPQCLLGAKQTITNFSPVIAVCVYHLQSHVWEIPLQLYSYNKEYSFHLCPHLADGWDLVLYAVPKNRRPIKFDL